MKTANSTAQFVHGIWDVSLSSVQWDDAVDHIQAYGDQRAAEARKKALEDAARICEGYLKSNSKKPGIAYARLIRKILAGSPAKEDAR